MNWADASTYVEAIQSPRLAFLDPDLKNGTVALDKLGLPKPISGNFAVVFEVRNGIKKWAVRCFLRNVPDQERRYAAIEKHLDEAKLSCTVRFDFQGKGILAKGKWYPIVKMEWVEGIRLDEYIRDNLYNTSALKTLMEGWLSLASSLRANGIAHGDFQHGNILITRGAQLKIVDYDGMYVPGVIGQQNHEIGHRNYQHPSRINDSGVTHGNYLNIDNFSSWVIGTSLALVCIDPSLWSQTRAGDDNLLFRADEYKQPYRTATWQRLTGHTNRHVRELGRTLADLSEMPSFLAVPPLDSNLRELKSASQPNAGAGWLTDHIQSGKAKSQKSHWLVDHVTENEPSLKFYPDSFILEERRRVQQEFQNLPLLERAKYMLQWQKYVSEYVMKHFPHYKFVKNKQRIEIEMKDIESQRHLVVNRLSIVQQQFTSIEQKQRQYANTQKEIDTLRRELGAVPAELGRLSRLEQDEVAASVRSRLALRVITPGTISGIGKARIAALNSVGVFSAADIVPGNKSRVLFALRGIYKCVPEHDWNKLLAWRKVVEDVWIKSSYLDSATHQIKAKYDTLRGRLLLTEGQKKQRLANLERTSWMGTPSDSEVRKLETEVKNLERERDKMDAQLEECAFELRAYIYLTPQSLISKLIAS